MTYRFHEYIRCEYIKFLSICQSLNLFNICMLLRGMSSVFLTFICHSHFMLLDKLHTDLVCCTFFIFQAIYPLMITLRRIPTQAHTYVEKKPNPKSEFCYCLAFVCIYSGTVTSSGSQTEKLSSSSAATINNNNAK